MISARISRGVVSRADLLRGLALKERDSLALDESARAWWGYLLKPVAEFAPESPSLPSLPPQTGAVQDAGLTPQLPCLWAVTRHEALSAEHKPRLLEIMATMTENDAKAKSPVSLAVHRDLLPWARLLPTLLKPVRQPQLRGLDVPRWVDQWARLERTAPWPRKTVWRLPVILIVILDFAERLWPYRSDMHRLCHRLLALCGRDSLSLRVFFNGPQGGWSDWLAEQKYLHMIRDWDVLPAGTQILIVSDLGAHSRLAAEHKAWLDFVISLNSAKLHTLALCPV